MSGHMKVATSDGDIPQIYLDRLHCNNPSAAQDHSYHLDSQINEGTGI